MTHSREHIQTNIYFLKEIRRIKPWLRCRKKRKLTIQLSTRRHCLFTFICRNNFSPLFYLRQSVHAKFAQLYRRLIYYNFSLFSHRHRRPIVIFLMPRGIGSIWRDILQFSLSLFLSLRFKFNSECQIHVHVRQNPQLTVIESGYNGSSNSSSPHWWDKTTNITENQINFHWHPFVVAHIRRITFSAFGEKEKEKNLFVSNECELRTHSRARTLNELSDVRALISRFAPARSRYYYVLFRRKWNV